jgi:hypothetical protein
MRAFLLILLLQGLQLSAQYKDFMLTRRGDTLNRVDLAGKRQGPWVVSVPELRGERGYEEEGHFFDDAKEGVWKRFSLEGVKIAEENYRWGKLHGKQLYYSYFGGLIREENWRAMDPKQAYDTVAVFDLKDPDKKIADVIVKNEGISLRHGVFSYYDPRSGKLLAKENYVMNKLQEEDSSGGAIKKPIEKK